MSQEGTPLGQGQGSGASAPVPSGLDQFHGELSAQSGKLGEAAKTLEKVRGVLGKLASQGDAVTAEDVIEGAGQLVAHGLSPMAMASLLADMPEGGQALQGWVQEHLQGLQQREQQLQQVQGQVRHQQSQAALHLLARDHVGAAQSAMGGVPSPGPANDLTPGPGAPPDAS